MNNTIMNSQVTKAPASTLAAIRIFGANLDFDDITSHLGPPSGKHLKGDRGVGSLRYSEDMWCLDSPYPRIESLDVHLTWLRDALEHQREFLHALNKRFEVTSYCGISVDGDSCRLLLTAESLQIFFSLDIDLNLSAVFTGYSDLHGTVHDKVDLEHADDLPSNERIRASFQVSAFEQDLQDISDGLGLESSVDHRWEAPSSSGEPYQLDLWSIVSAPGPGASVDQYLRSLAAGLLPRYDYLRRLKRRAGLLARCEVGTVSDNPVFAISPAALRICEDLDIPLEFRLHLI